LIVATVSVKVFLFPIIPIPIPKPERLERRSDPDLQQKAAQACGIR